MSEFGLGDFLGSPAATPRLSSETPVAFDLRSAHATRLVRHKMHLGYKYKFNSPASPSRKSVLAVRDEKPLNKQERMALEKHMS